MSIPRRIQLEKNISAEKAIRKAVEEVEALAAHPLLTDAVVLLQQAREKVADWFDYVENDPSTPATTA